MCWLIGLEAFQDISKVESDFINVFKDKYENHSIDDFGSGSYQGSLASIMYDYWRSYLLVKKLVGEANDNIELVFNIYHKWHNEGRRLPLSEYFQQKLLFR